jgi:hypothetical protein
MENGHLTRRSLLKTAALATTTLTVPFVHSAFAAGKLACGFWDHWVPGANNTLTKLCKEWGDKEKVDVAIDYITSQGDKNLLTIAAEAQSRGGMISSPFRPGTPPATPRISNRSTTSSTTWPRSTARSPLQSNISANKRAIGLQCRRPLAAKRSRHARGSTCSSSMPDSI